MFSDRYLVIDDWAGNKFSSLQPFKDIGGKGCYNRLGEGGAYNNTGESNGKGDYLYKEHRDQCVGFGLDRGTYWVIDPLNKNGNTDNWKYQFDWVTKNYPNDEELPFGIDIEVGGTNLVDYVGNFAKSFTDYYHQKPIFYSSKNFWKNSMMINGLCPDYQLMYDDWLAAYPFDSKLITCDWNTLITQYAPSGWIDPLPSTFQIASSSPIGWQWSGDKFVLPGINGYIDLNWMNKDWYDKNRIDRGNVKQDNKDNINMRLMQDMNVRSGPGKNYNVVGSKNKNESILVADIAGSDAWVKIGENQWICVELGIDKYLAIES